MTTIEDRIARLNSACAKEPVDWDAIRGEALVLDASATTKEQKAAAEALKRACRPEQVHRAIAAIGQAFSGGKPGGDGWPKPRH
jgi:hypothetical protein